MICGVVLAAGRSERMGTQKLVLPWGEKTIISRIVDELRRSTLDKIFVVVGRDEEKVRRALQGEDVEFVSNPDIDGEMLSSIRCGLRMLPAVCEAAMVVLGDQPNLSYRLVDGIVRTFRESKQGIVVPRHGKHRGHPVLIAARFHPELLRGYDQVGLRGLLDAHAKEVAFCEVLDERELLDMDTPEEYEKGRKIG